ncbi:MAG: nucleotide exchange factor GrpE [Nanoarchaeota archaeon]|nr:nucleotide exchange factor GrpE [Nanoarchaeota archaeon]
MKNEENPKEAQKEEETQKEEQSLLEQLQRLQAEFINYRTRVEKEKSQIKELTKEITLLKFLDIKDNFDRAPKLDEGMELIYKQFQKIFKEESIQEIENEVFDPQFHEAIATDPNSEKDKIMEVIQKGYKRNEILMRPSKVVVGINDNNIGEKKNE